MLIEADAEGGRTADCGRRTADDEQKVRTPRKDVGKKMRSQFHHPRLSPVWQALSHPEHWFAGPAGCCFGNMMKNQTLESIQPQTRTGSSSFDAVIRNKLLYSLETIHLTQSLRKKLDALVDRAEFLNCKRRI